MIGTASDLIAEIRELEDAGLDQIVWQCTPGHEDEVRRFAAEVMAPYQQRFGTEAAEGAVAGS
jgi:hypothetical protein